MIIRGRAPLRITFAGGGTDLNEVFENYGGAAVNAAISKFTYMTIKKRKDKKILINQLKLDESDDFTKKIIEKASPLSGLEITYYNEILPGRGLGSSSTYATLLFKLIYEIKDINISKIELVEKIYGIESEVGKCGWQDIYSAIFGGVNYIEFSKSGKTVYPLRTSDYILRDLESRLLLIYSKKDHDAKSLESLNVKTMTEEKANKLIYLAKKTRDSILHEKISDLGNYLSEAWKIKRNNITSNPEIDKLYNLGIKNGAISGKLLGAGQGGYMMFFSKPENIFNLINKFSELGYEIILPKIQEKGIETWRV